jgi:hypothetical protein
MLMNLRSIHKACVLFLLLVSMLIPAKMGMGQTYTYERTIKAPTVSAYSEASLIHSNGKIYVGTGNKIEVFNLDGTLHSTIGSLGSGQVQWTDIHGMCELSNGNILLAEYNNNRLQEITVDGGFVRTVAFSSPQSVVALPNGGFIADSHFGAYAGIFDKDGVQLSTFSCGSFPTQMLLASDGTLHITNIWSHSISRYSLDGTLLGQYGGGGHSLSQPYKLAQLPDKSIVVCEREVVSRFTEAGEFIEVCNFVAGSKALSIPHPSVATGNGYLLFVTYYGPTVTGQNYYNLQEQEYQLFSTAPDVSSPTSTFSANPSTTWSNTDITATITSVDNAGGTGVKEIHYGINMGAEQIVSSSTATFTLIDNGTHSISYFAVDNVGNTESAQLATVKIDKIAPVTTLTRNAGLISLSATDAHSGVSKIKYQINGGAVADYSAPFADTIHTVTYWAEDVATNVEAAKTDIINAGVQSISVTQPQVTGGVGVIGTVTLDKAAGVGGTVINLASSLPGVAVVDATVTVPEGATTATFDIDANPVSVATSVSITASIYETSQSALITITAPAPVLVTWSTSPVTGGTSTTGTLIISGPAPAGGSTVSLASSSLSALVASSVTIPAGAMTATFTVTTNVVSNDTSAVISATVYGTKLKSTLSILGPKVSSVTLAAASIASTTTTTGTVTLSTNAPVGGKVVNLSSSNAAVASVPVSVTVAAGARTATFIITAGTVNANTNATITATTNGSTGTAIVTVTPPAAVLATLTTNVSAVTGGRTVTGTVTLTSAAPTGGAVVTLTSSSTTIGTVPASVTVAAGSTTATFTVTTRTVTVASSLTITGTRNGVAKAASITVNPVRVVSTLTLNPTSVRGGTNSTGTITLSGVATEAVVVTLTSGTTAVARVPASVTVPAGSSTATFTITTLAQTATRTSVITARTGTTSRTATLSVTR